MKLEKNELKQRTGGLTLLLFVTGLNLVTQVTAQDKNEDSKIFDLSPFTIDASEDRGYSATSTLAGTRIRTELKDLGAAISVVTSEFMDDTGATDAGTLLSYTTNTEVGGLQGNFSGGEPNNVGRVLQTDERTNPQFNQRVRGLGSADLTRGYFLTDIPFDSFNTDRVDISRGPNSLLFGIGSPGGVINNTPKQAIQGSNFSELKVRFDNYGSMRSEFDTNLSVVDGRFAIRLAGLYDDTEYKQKPAWNRDKRLYAAVDIVLLENTNSDLLGATTLRANVESGVSTGSPVEIIPPTATYHNWFEPIPRNIAQYTGMEPPSYIVSPSEGGTWEFQETYNPFARNLESQINTSTHPFIFQQFGFVYNNADDTVADHGTGDGLQGFTALFPWSPSRDTLASTGYLGTPGAIAAFGSDAPGSTPVRSMTWYTSNSPYSDPFALGFSVPTLQNTDVFDYRNLVYGGGIDYVERKFSAANFALEQSFFDNRLGIEIAYDDQHYETYQDFLFSGGGTPSASGPYDIYVDIAEYLLDGQPNPNLGRANTRVRSPTIRFDERDRETFRVTAFGNVDFTENDGWLKHLGRHRFTGLYNDYKFDTHNIVWLEGFSSHDFPILGAARNHGFDGPGRWGNVVVYTSDNSLLGLSSMDDIRLNQIKVPRHEVGSEYNVFYADLLSPNAERRVKTGNIYVDPYMNSENMSRTLIEAKAFSWQSYLLGEHIVGLYGYREDDTENYSRATEAEVGLENRLADGGWNPNFARLSKTPSLVESGDTTTWSIVGRYPEKLLGDLPWGMDLQVHLAESENFNPIGLRNDALGRAIGQPTGTTKEYGFLTSFADNKFSVKVNWFETSLNNVNANPSVNIASEVYTLVRLYREDELLGIPWNEGGHLNTVVGDPASFPIQDYATFYDRIQNAVPSILQNIVNPRQEDSNGDGIWDRIDWDNIPALRSTQDRVAEGFEVELTANPTPGWRIIANISQQETVNSNTAAVMSEVVEEYNDNLQAVRLGELRRLDVNRTTQIRSINEIWLNSVGSVRAAKALDNTVSNEQREWRFTAVTNYEFLEGGLKGFAVGGAARWEDEAATGYVTFLDPEIGIPVPDLNRPFYDDGLFSGDLWLSYNRKIWGGKVDWKIQLNVRNAFGDDHDIPVKTNPDGKVAVIRIPNPRTIYLSNTFRF